MAKFRRVRNDIRRALDDAHEKYINDIRNVDVLKEKTKRFGSYIKSKKKDQVGISALRSNKGLATEEKEKAELLSEQYKSVFTDENTDEFPTLPTNTTCDMSEISVQKLHVICQKYQYQQKE